MEGWDTDEEKKKKKSFSFADQLIDIMSESDDFLVASPFCDSLQDSFSDSTARGHLGFRLSGFGNSPEVETAQQKEQNLLLPPYTFVQPHRPSYLRKSLAWDSAFLDSPGVLDHDELSFINKGLGKTLDVRKRRCESDSTTNGDYGFSSDWFEIEPLTYKSRPCEVSNAAYRSIESGLEQDGLQKAQALKKSRKSARNKMKSNQTSTGESILVQKKSAARTRQGTISSHPKPPKAIKSPTSHSTRSKNRDSSRTTTDSGQGLAVKKKSTPQSSSSRIPYSLSSPKFSSIVSPTAALAHISNGASSAQAYNSLSKLKTESRKNQLSASLSTSKIWKHSERSNGMANNSLSTRPLSLSKTILKAPFNMRNDAKESSDFHSSFHSQSRSPRKHSSLAISAENFRPSELRPPSPRMRFFDENTPPKYHGATRSRKVSQKVLSKGTPFDANTQFDHLNTEFMPDKSIISSRHASACKKKPIKSPFSETPKNTTEINLGKRPRNKLGPKSSFEEEKTRDVLKYYKRCRSLHDQPKDSTEAIKKDADQENTRKKILSYYGDNNQLDHLSRFFEAIDLNQENNRTPLADKSSACNFMSGAFESPLMGSKKEKLVQKENV